MFEYHKIRDMKKLLALPNRKLRLSEGQGVKEDDSDLLPSTRSRRTPKDLSLEEILPDNIDENEKLEVEGSFVEQATMSEQNDVDIQEEIETETHTKTSSPFPITDGSAPHQLQPPTHTQPIKPDFDHD